MVVITQDEIMSKCWDSPHRRDCSYCRAYHKRSGGECCFGLRYDDEDPQCRNCPHCNSCREAMIRSNGGGRTVISRPVNKPKFSRYATDQGGNLTTPDEYDEEEEEDPRKKKLTLKHTLHRAGHGALEGACELILGSLRYRRPPP